METSPNIESIAKALKEFHELAITVSKDATNPHFRSMFASLDHIIETIRLPLASRGLAFAQFPDGDGLTTILVHSPSGEWMKATANLKLAKEDPQGQGSAYTYARRYALAAILGLATDEDDDGNEGSKPPQTSKTAPQATKPAPTNASVEIAARKDRIAFLLKSLGFKATGKTKEAQKKQYEDAVFDITGLMLSEENYGAIAETLSAKLETKEAEANH